MERKCYAVKEIGELAQNVKNGDQNAVAEIYEAIRPAMLKKAYKQLSSHNKSQHNAEDVFEDTFIKCMEKIDTLQSPAAFVNWFSISLTNYANTWNKKNDVSRLCTFSDIEDTSNGSAEHKENPLDSVLAKVAAPEPDDASNELSHALNQITSEQKELLTLFYLDNYSYRDICKMKNLKYSTLVGKIQTAKKKLKKAVLANRSQMDDQYVSL